MKSSNAQKPLLITSARPFFVEMVKSAIDHRRVKSPPTTQMYLVDLMEFYLSAGNLTTSSTLAEMFLTANKSEPSVRGELLKRLGDVALYTSGFFGDSLNRKLVDVDYYAEIGGSAYGALANGGESHNFSMVYEDLAGQFLNYVEVLTYISQVAMVQSNQDLLRLYSRYLATGSKLAEEQLIERGVINLPAEANKSAKQ